MFISMALLVAGCALRVSSEVLAYQGFISSAQSRQNHARAERLSRYQ
jgi:hypothetical protein